MTKYYSATVTVTTYVTVEFFITDEEDLEARAITEAMNRNPNPQATYEVDDLTLVWEDEREESIEIV